MKYSIGYLTALFLLTLPMAAHAAKPVKAVKATKERLVLMPLRVAEEDKNLQGAMETALVEGLHQKYEVFSGEQVAQKAREIFLKESRNTAKKECDETRCMQGIAEAFQAELIATANVTKREDGYFLALSVQNIFDTKVVYSKSTPCKNCDAYQVVEKLKELSGAPVQTASSTASNIDPNASAPEDSLWAEVQKGNSTDDYDVYLAQYPKGKYVALAQMRITKMKKDTTQAVTQAPQPGQTFRDCPDCPEMVVIPQGSFDMGEINDAHRVTFSKAFAMGKTEVTQGQWKAIMGNNPSSFSNCGDTCPVEQVNWNDAKEFIQKLNTKSGKHYRLPSEAEWEYACRAGGKNEYCGSDNVDSVAWNGKNSNNTTHPVAQKQANAFSLYDMSGNVWEWVEDGYHESYIGAPVDGTAWHGGVAQRVFRGGSWYLLASTTCSACRGGGDPAIRNDKFGFRLARTLP